MRVSEKQLRDQVKRLQDIGCDISIEWAYG